MNPENELLRAYHEWHRLAQAETKAIQTRNWDLLTDCHLAIKDFQTHIGKLAQETRSEWRRSGCNLAEKERNLQVLVAGLIDLTRHNQGLLQTTLAAARQQRDRLGETGNNLRLLRRSYAVTTDWNRAN